MLTDSHIAINDDSTEHFDEPVEDMSDDEQNISKKSFTDKKLQMALEAVQNGMSYSSASKMYNIPQTRLKTRLKTIKPVQEGKRRKPAKKYYSRRHKELPMVKSLHALADAGFTITNKLIRIFAEEYIKDNIKQFPGENPFPAEIQWMPQFVKRHPSLTIRMSENRCPYGSDPEAPERLEAWFESVTRYLENMGLQTVIQKPRHVFTIDDMILRGNRNDVAFTCLFGANAYGNLLPPLVLYPDAIKVPTQIEQSKLKYVVAHPDIALTTENSLYQWLSKVFEPWLIEQNVPRPVILFVDGHRYQMGYLSSHFCKKHQIVLVSLLSRSANKLRPLNDKLFETIKNLWHDEMQRLGKLSSMDQLLLKPILDQLSDAESIIRDGFFQSKIYPWNRKDSQLPPPVGSPQRRTADPDLALFRKMLESRMTEQELAEFQAHRHDEVWQGPVEHTSLFGVWRDLLHEDETSEGAVSLADSEMQSAQEDTGECLLDFVKEEPRVGYEDL